MTCCQCQGIEKFFDERYVARELSRYRRRGADKTTRWLLEALKTAGVSGLTLLDIGGGVGAISHALLQAGVTRACSVEGSPAYLQAARAEAERRGHAGRIDARHGNFVDLAGKIAAADIVTLDRVICCYPDMHRLVGLSAARARRFYGLVYPRDTWWVKLALGLQNLFFRLRRNPFRTFAHPSRQVEALVNQQGLRQRFYRRTLIWQVVLYAR